MPAISGGVVRRGNLWRNIQVFLHIGIVKEIKSVGSIVEKFERVFSIVI